ncbi:NUC173 domain protein [Toxoplasma gondii GAB2-2007-GAL-DOM2]|uniref:RRP12 HEAT domain-containing protein n=3 Tax=Toxoplasma gondii TaxID=5811 RepID=S7UUS6_TOXGG|nr:hypothetical protein TGGT1_202980 [Toxoplasma gondii GT1]KAF4642874.1 hypothetical protein TGRH88_036030 [Toxoplasma gondii]KFG37715.1 NUC173 domain protein [Toxoplasma gondii GAB2-2007-GAL-DOM2]
MGTLKAPDRLRGRKAASSVPSPSRPSVCSSSDDAALATLLKERQVFKRTEELLRKRAQEAETLQDEGEDMENSASSRKRDEEDDFLLSNSEGSAAGSPLLLSRCSPFDADAALDCLHLLRQGLDSQTGVPAVQGKGDQTNLLTTSLHTLLMCVCKEAASCSEAPDNERTRRITTGLSLLFALLVDEGLPQSPAERHRKCHEDAALLDNLLKAIEAVSSFMQAASPRPLLLLLHALRRMYVPSQGADEQEQTTCGCLPTRAVWTCLLHLLTEDPRASVRWLARQVALHFLRLATQQVTAQTSNVSQALGDRKRKKARDSLQTCLYVLDRWLRHLDFSVVPDSVASRVSASSALTAGDEGSSQKASSVPASMRLQRSLPFFHRCLPPLLCLESVQSEDEKRSVTADSRASLPQQPHKAAEALCIHLAFLSRKAGRTPAAADALRCVAAVIRDLRRFRGNLEQTNNGDSSASVSSKETNRRTGDDRSGGRQATTGSAFSLTVQLLPALLQQQRAQGAQRGLWDELGGEKGKGSGAVLQGAVQYATAWLDAVTATTAALMHWAGEAREAWTPPQAVGEAPLDGCNRGETSGVTNQEEENLDETLLLQQLEKLSLGGSGSDAQIKTLIKDSEGFPLSSSSAASVSLSSYRLSICMQASERVFRSLRRVLESETDPSILGAASVAGRRLIEASGAASVPAFPAAVPFCLSLLHFRHKRRLAEGLEASRALFAALEAVACKQFLVCSMHPELEHFRRPLVGDRGMGKLTSSSSQEFDGKCLPQFLHKFLDIYRPCFTPLLRQIVSMLAVVETGEEPEQVTERQDEKKRVERKTKTVEEIFGLAKDNRARTDLRQHDVLPYRGRIRVAFSAALRAFKARTVLTDPHLLPIRPRIPLSRDLSPQQLGFLLERCPVTNAWALPLLPRLLGRDELHFFSSHFLQLARLLQQQTAEKAKTSPLEARELCRVGQQLWSLLPGFSYDPIDLATGVAEEDFSLMKNMIQFLHDPVLREEICSTIRNLSNAAISESDVASIRDDDEDDDRQQRLEREERDDAEKDVMSVLCRVTKPCGKESMQACGSQLMGFLVVRFLQVQKVSLKNDEEAAGERALAAMLLGEKEDLEQLTQSAKMKATQHLLDAIKAYAPLCPPELLHANVRRFTSAFLRRANEAAGLSAPSAAAPVTMGVAECSALVDITDALHPFLPSSVGLEVVDSLRTLVAVCAQGLEKAGSGYSEQSIDLVETEKRGKNSDACRTEDNGAVLRALLRRGYKALKHVFERSASSSRASSLADGSASESCCFLRRQELEILWEILAKTRTVSCGTAAEKPRLGCLRAFVECLTLSAQTAEDSEDASTQAFWESFLVDRVFPTVVPEIILSLKSLNRLVRETAFCSLSGLCDACDGDSEKLSRLVILIATGLGGGTGVTARGGTAEPPLLKTAAVLALSRVIFSYAEQMDGALIKQIAEVVLLLLQDRDKQVFLAALRFARVIAHVFDGQALERFLPAMLCALNNKHAIRAKMKIRRLVEKLLKKLGEAAVKEAFPSEHLPLLRHLQKSVRKQQLRELLVNKALQEGLSWDELVFKPGDDGEDENKNAGRRQGKKENNAFSKMMEEDDEEDEDDEDRPSAAKKAAARKRGANAELQGEEEEVAEEQTENKDGSTSFSAMTQLLDAFEEEDDSDTEGRRNRNRKRRRATSGDQAMESDVMLLEDNAGELPLDFCSPAAAHRIILNQPLSKHRRRLTTEVERKTVANLTWNEEGRLVIPEDEDEESDKDPGFTIGKVSSVSKRSAARRVEGGSKSSSTSLLAKNRKAPETGGQRKNLSCLAARRAAMKTAKKERRRGHFVQKSGDEFKAKKARGDVKQNNKVEPFAYIRLNRVMLREKHRPQALQSLATLVKKRRGGDDKGKSKTGVRKPMNKARKGRR